MNNAADVIIIGAGIAGASLASELANDRKVILLEAEDHPGYHATGRSAAVYLPTYGPEIIIALTKASGSFFHHPPADFTENNLLSPRPTLMIAKPGDDDHITQALHAGMIEIPIAEARNRLPALRPDIHTRAMIDTQTMDIDVDALLQAHLKKAKRLAVQLQNKSRVEKIERNGSGWTVFAASEKFSAPVIVNAAGAWADPVAELAGVRQRGIQPKRRSAALIDVSDKWDISDWPLCVEAGNTFYFRPMSGKLMISPADETVCQAHDAWADDMQIAEAIERFRQVTGYEVSHIEHTWAGLRSFASDGDPVVGFDPDAEGFFWLVGQGGYGIQTSPALSRLAANLVCGRQIPEDIADFGVTRAALSPNRF
jgi:D-arginine dehydrogenase